MLRQIGKAAEAPDAMRELSESLDRHSRAMLTLGLCLLTLGFVMLVRYAD